MENLNDNEKKVDSVVEAQSKLANNAGKKQKKHILPVGKIDEYPEDENAHIVGSNVFVDGIVFDDKFEYIVHNPIKRFFMDFIWGIGIVLLSIVNALIFGFYVKGKKYSRQVKKSKKGAITVSNHCMGLDCVMACQANCPKMTYLPTLHTTFQLPYVRHIVRWLNAFPIPNTTSGTIKFVKEVDEVLQKGKFVHFFPEASLWPWYDRVRTFKPGAFSFAIRNDVPVLPLVVLFRPRKITRLFLKRPKVSIQILEPMYADPTLKGKAQINELTQRVHDAMQHCVEENNLKYYGKKSTKAHID